MKQIVLNNLPSRSAAVDCLALVRAAYGAAADLVTVAAGPYFYGFHAVYTVPAVDGWPALVDLMSASGRPFKGMIRKDFFDGQLAAGAIVPASR